ncbi:hypothetical protein HPB50_022699 [Hyalomma asiaticum]|uniref:Uncharacterized protein n=1 Tax=Hyalomma asiaticum TaxID=266040 RepID=A0ACB7SYI9_HYAAI|nr:hypothetical protein HPB50_022699 [Hyalomma asiaticum]
MQEETAEEATDKHVLPAATASEVSEGQCSLLSSVGAHHFGEPRLSKDIIEGVEDLAQGAQRRIVRSASPETVVPRKRRRVQFTALQEEALVYGVMKYGRGSWKEISSDGWFDGRRTTELSDKYRNLERYGHIANIKKKVKDKLSTGVDPLKELRTKYEQQRLQHTVSLVRRQSSNSKQSNMDQPRQLQRTSPSLEDPEGDGVAQSSDDDISVKSLQKPSEATEATTMTEAICSCTSKPFTLQARSPALNRWSSESEEDALLASGPGKTKNKKRRKPFTQLEEQALVAGVLKYGTGNWARILKEGGFLGRTNLQLSDKYRNLKQYRYLQAVENAVNIKRARGEDPLEELRNLSALHWRC